MPILKSPVLKKNFASLLKKDAFKLTILASLNLGMVLYQNLRITVLGDLTYIIDHAYRISKGQVLYKDFGVIVSPGTFLIQAAVIKIFGLSFIPQIIYCCCISALTVIIVYKILLLVNPKDNLNFYFVLPTVIAGGYIIFPHPVFDVDCIFFILLEILLILYSYNNKFSNLSLFISGVFAVIPLFFKQNLGLSFIVSLHLTVFIVSVFKKNNLNLKKYVIFLSGSTFSIVLSTLLINLTCGLENYFYWTYDLAKAGKGMEHINLFRLLLDMLRIYYIKLPVIISTLLLLVLFMVHKKINLTGGFSLFLITIVMYILFLLSPVYYILITGNNIFDGYNYIWISLIALNLSLLLILIIQRSTFENYFITLLPLIPIFIINGGLLGGDIQYMTYGFWPLFSLLICMMMVNFRKVRFFERIKINIILVSITVLTAVVLIFYISSEYRLRYIDLNGKITSSDYPALRGLAAPGNYLLDLQKLVEYTNQEIPKNEGIVVIPAEDPFYTISDRIPVFTVSYFYWREIPYTEAELINMINYAPVKWLIIKTRLQLNFSFMDKREVDFDTLISNLKNNFKLHKELSSYQIYKKEN